MTHVRIDERPSTPASREEALRMARSLEHALAELALHAAESERHSLRLADAIAGSLVDQLQALCDASEMSGLRLVRPEDDR